MEIKLSWTDFKAFVDLKKISIQYFEIESSYYLYGFDGIEEVNSQVEITDPANEDQTDFEENYKSIGNQTNSVQIGGKDNYDLTTTPISAISLGDVEALVVYDRNQPAEGGSVPYSLSINDTAYPNSLATKCNAISFDVSGTWTGELKVYIVLDAQVITLPVRQVGSGTIFNTITTNGLYIAEGADCSKIYLQCTALSFGSPLVTVSGSVTNSGTYAYQAGSWNINNISGTISLPTGAATSSLQTTANTSLASIDTKLTSPLSSAQSGTWNITNVSGTVSLPTGAATLAGQTQPGVDIGDVTINNSTGASAVNIQDGGNSITIDGTVAATQSGNWSVRNQDGSGNAISSTSSALDINIKSGSIPTGSNVIGKTSIDQTTPGTTNLVAAGQNGTWNITNVSGTVSLPTGAATLAGQTQPGVDIGDVTINNSTGAAAVNIQDGGNSITVDGTITSSQSTSSTATITSVAGNASTVQLLASTAGRKLAMFFNDSTSNCYLKLGTTASTTSFTVLMTTNSYYELPQQPIYTGRIDAIWDTATGNMRITELT